MNMKNKQIYELGISFINLFHKEIQENKIKLPIKVNFYFQKNKNKIIELAQELEKMRLDIINNYPKISNDAIFPEDVERVNAELQELLNLEQDVQIYKVKLSDFPDDLNLTLAQMDALMFMIEEE